MKRLKKVYILLGILALACIATIAVIGIERHKENIKNSDEIILEIPSEDVQSLSWTYENETLSFHKDDKWLYDGDSAFPVSEDKINELLEQFNAFGAAFIIEDVSDYAQYGLDKPICEISLSTDSENYKITLGNYSNMDSQRYVSIGDGNVYLMKTDPLDYFEAVLSDVIDNDTPPEFDTVSKLSFSGEQIYNAVYEEDSTDTYCADDVYFAQIDGKNLPLDTSRVNGYLDGISSLALTDYVTYNATDEQLSSYGLDAPQLSVTVDYTYKDEDGKDVSDTFVLNVSRDPKEQAKAVSDEETSDEEEEITAYARVGDSQIVYKITGEEYKALMASTYDDLRHLEALSASLEDVTQIDITLDGKSYTVTADGKDDDRKYTYNEEDIDASALTSAISALSADSFTSETPTQKQEISFTVHLDNENYPEIEISLYRYDGTYCLAEINGEPTSLIKRSYVVDLIEAVNAIVL